ncbi:cyanobactin maturation protease PatG family protein [Streptomyces jumonjinensis]|uniref:cyanobactin maturation protease PatG family protein n=1 Tax=Streptomyces jumonjinensis TaxID=1945 RepID=UPI0037B9516B
MQSEPMDPPIDLPADDEVRPPPPEAAPDGPGASPETPSVTQACCGCGATGGAASAGGHDGAAAESAGPGYVYVLGRVRAVFPDISVQREFGQVAGEAKQADATDADALYRVLTDPENRYIARQMCYVLSVQGVDTYLLEPADPMELPELLEALRPIADQRDLAVIVGYLGPVAPPGACQGLSVPVVRVEKIWAFDSKELIQAIERPAGASRKDFEKAAGALLDRMLQLSDNAGTGPADRALNYLTVRNQEIYQKTNEEYGDGYALSAVEAVPSRLSGAQTVITAIFSYTHRQTNVTEKWSVRVGVDGLFPYPVTPLQTYYNR